MFWLIQSLPLVFCLGSGNAASQSSPPIMKVNGAVGESITLPLMFAAEEKIQVVTWQHNEIVIAIIQRNKFGSPEFLIPSPKCKEQPNFTLSYSLHFCNLTRADSGSYKAQINAEASPMILKYELMVFGRLRNLQVSHHIRLSGNGICEIHLTCSVENPNDTVSFGWQVSGNTSLNEPNLTVFWDSKNSSDQSYMCIAENPVSNLSHSVSAKSLCKDTLTKENLSRHNLYWILICGIPIVIIVLTLVCRKRRGSVHLPTQQTQHPAEPSENIELASISPGSTVYAQVTHPQSEIESLTHIKSDDPITIYSTVNHSKQNKLTYPRATSLYTTK